VFITFEGPEGSGKTTQVALLADFLRQAGYQVLATREPGGTRIGDSIRDCLHDVCNTAMAVPTELLLYSASRAQLVAEVIRPALARGDVVLCDRYSDSTIAYQGFGRGISLEALRQITHFATGGLSPELTLLLDIDVARGLARRSGAGIEMNRLDLETVEFHRRVRDGYHRLAAAEPERWRLINADRPNEAIQADIRRAVMERLGRPGPT
jgi:dTMP kinase